jgi:hypothetical protein
LVDEALQVLRDTQMSPREHWEFLIQNGIIDRNGRVLLCKLFGTDEENDNEPPAGETPTTAPSLPHTSDASTDRATTE